MPPMFRIRFKVRGKVQVWERFARNLESARIEAKASLDKEYFGDAVLISVEPI